MNKRANLLKHVKGASGWRYYPVVWLRNGSVRPNYVLVNGKAEHHPFTRSSGMSVAGVDGRQWERKLQKHKRPWKDISIAFVASR